jgi:anti-sigma B factor antagonist
MTWQIHKEAPLAVVEIDGAMGGGPHADSFRSDILALADEGWVNVILDLSKVRYVYSPGIGMILGAYTSLRNRGGEMKLVVNTERVRNLLHLIQLYKVLDIPESREEARTRFLQYLEKKSTSPDAGAAKA